MFKNPIANGNPITIAAGGSNGYLLFGTSGSQTLSPGDFMLVRRNDSLPDVDSTHKNIAITGTGAQVLDFELIAG